MPVYSCPSDSLRLAFMESLASDLELVGHKVLITEFPKFTTFSLTKKDYYENNSQELRAEMRNTHELLRNRNLPMHANLISRMEQQGILDMIIDGKDTDFGGICPEIVVCKKNEHNIFNYFRLSQSVPNSPSVGRNIYAFVHDVGQKTKPLMGLIGLSSSVYSVKDRDSFFGWNSIDSKSQAKAVKDSGLRRVMQLAVCMALPPYSFLHGGKLMALLSLSSPIQSIFQQKYQDPLIALVTTTANGDHAAMFNRLQRNKLDSHGKYQGESVPRKTNEFFQHIGNTSGDAFYLVSQKTVELARVLVTAEKTNSHKSSGKAVVHKALNLCGIKKEVLRFPGKGLYVGYINKANLSALRDPQNYDPASLVLDFPVKVATEYWRENWLPKGRIPDALMFTRDELALSKFLS